MKLASLAALLLAAAGFPALAQVDTTRPFVRGGIYDKPFLGRLAGRAAIGGYAEAHARYRRVDGAVDESGFVARRFNLFANAAVSEIVRLAAELEVEEGGEEVKLEFAAIDVTVHPALTFRGGMLLSPIGKFNLAHDSPLNEFTDRPLVATEIIGVALSEPGFGAYGQFSAGERGRVTYEAYLTNGYHDGLVTASEDGTRIPLGRGNHEDNNSSPALAVRLAWSPAVTAEFGASVHHGAYNVHREDGLDVDSRRDLTIVVVDGEYAAFGVELRGEAAFATIDIPPGLGGIYAGRQRGWYAELIRPFGRGLVATLPSSSLAVKLRAESVDFDTALEGDDVVQLSGGVNFRPTSDTAIKFDYVRGRSRDRFAVPADHAALLLSFATYF